MLTEKLDDSFKDERMIDTGLSSDLDMAIIQSVFGQLSDGLWENSTMMDHYWPYIDVEKKGGRVILEVSIDSFTRGYPRNRFLEMNDSEIKTWLAKKIKAVIKEEGLDWSRSNREETDFLSTDWRLPSKERATVADCYYVYEVLRGRNVSKHPEYASMKVREYKREIMKEEMTVEEAMKILKESGKKAVNESYLEQVNVEELYKLALDTLFFADQVHLWHWTGKSGFHHTHLEEVYDSLRDFADELVEICLASGKKFAVKTSRDLGGDGDFDIQDAIDEIEDFIDQIQATSEKFEGYTEITTLFDDEAKDLSKQLGLLKSFS